MKYLLSQCGQTRVAALHKLAGTQLIGKRAGLQIGYRQNGRSGLR
jgi:hypothetical protein